MNMDSYETLTLNTQNTKEKLNNLLFSKRFCGLCFDSRKCCSSLYEKTKIVTDDWTQDLWLFDVYSYVFKEAEDLPASNFICGECSEQLKKSYIFIKKSKLIATHLKAYLDDLESKTKDLITHLQFDNEIASANIVIVLEKNDISDTIKPKIENNNRSQAKEPKKTNRQHKNITAKVLESFDTSQLFQETKLQKVEDINSCTSDVEDDLDTSEITDDSEKVTIETEDFPNKEEIQRNKYKVRGLKCKKQLTSLKLDESKRTECNIHEFICTVCSKTFHSQQTLTAHYKVHSKVRCRICYLILPDSELKNHLREQHEDDVFICNICADVFYTLKYLRIHAKANHSVKHDLTDCDNSVPINDGKLWRKFGCPQCVEKPCIHNKYLISYRNQKLDLAPRIKCLDCNYVCTKKYSLIAHVNRKHLNHRPYTCDHCGLQFHHISRLRAHIINFHTEMNTSKDCDNSGIIDAKVRETGFKFVSVPISFTRNSEKLDKEKKKEDFPCYLSNKKQQSKRTDNVGKVHNRVQRTNRKKKLKCIICEKVFITRRELTRHLKSHGPHAKCRLCSVEYATLKKLKNHMNRKHGPVAVCDKCGKSMSKCFIGNHLKKHNSSNITCSICGKTCIHTIQLKQHMTTHLPKVPCPICSKEINPVKLRSHIKLHPTEQDSESSKTLQRPQIKCKYCDYENYSKIAIENHTNKLHLKIKPYVCHVCTKDFVGKNHLKNHLATHSLEKPILCVKCGKTFRTGHSLKLHLRVHTGEKNYPCDICGEKFRTSSIMNTHKIKKHSEPEVTCPLCDRIFYTEKELRSHVTKVHWKDKSRKFDPRELEGLEEHIDLFHDKRRIKLDENDIDFYMPCEIES